MDDQRIFIRPPLWLPVLVVVIGGLFYISGKSIEAENRNEPQSSITVSGEGKSFIAPDIARLNLGIQTGRQQSAAEAMERLKTGMDEVIAAIKAQGIEEKDIRTQSFQLHPVYDWNEGRQIPRGFEASQSLEVKVRDLDNVSDVLGAATAAGANQAGGISFTVDDPDAKRAEARAEAIEEAKTKAVQLADQLGVELGGIVNFQEGHNGGPMPPVMYDRAAYSVESGGADEAQAVQLPAGEQEINVQVSITYEID